MFNCEKKFTLGFLLDLLIVDLYEPGILTGRGYYLYIITIFFQYSKEISIWFGDFIGCGINSFWEAHFDEDFIWNDQSDVMRGWFWLDCGLIWCRKSGWFWLDSGLIWCRKRDWFWLDSGLILCHNWFWLDCGRIWIWEAKTLITVLQILIGTLTSDCLMYLTTLTVFSLV